MFTRMYPWSSLKFRQNYYRIVHFAHTNQGKTMKNSYVLTKSDILLLNVLLCRSSHSLTSPCLLSFLLKTHKFVRKWKTKWNSTEHKIKKHKKWQSNSSEDDEIFSLFCFIFTFFSRAHTIALHTYILCIEEHVSNLELSTASSNHNFFFSKNVSTYQTLKHCFKLGSLFLYSYSLNFWCGIKSKTFILKSRPKARFSYNACPWIYRFHLIFYSKIDLEIPPEAKEKVNFVNAIL